MSISSPAGWQLKEGKVNSWIVDQLEAPSIFDGGQFSVHKNYLYIFLPLENHPL